MLKAAALFRAPFDLIGAEITTANGYPGWKPNPSSKVVQKMADIYRKMFDAAPHVEACHAGLECGIIGAKYPGMDIVSFGPTIRGAHAPGEAVEIASVGKCWELLKAILAELATQECSA